jgi:ankyrin repeat protein
MFVQQKENRMKKTTPSKRMIICLVAIIGILGSFYLLLKSMKVPYIYKNKYYNIYCPAGEFYRNVKDPDVLSSIDAIQENDITKLGALLDKGLSIESMVDSTKSLLGFAIMHERREVINYLLKRGKKVEGSDFGWAMFASTNYCAELIDLLMTKGGDINATDELGRTAIFGAISLNPFPDKVELLRSRGAKLDVYSPRFSVLQYACRGGNEDQVRYVLQHAPRQLNYVNDLGFDAFYYATNSRKSPKEKYDLLLKYKTSIGTNICLEADSVSLIPERKPQDK